LPFQNNTIFGFGPGDDVKNVLNIQPVYPIHLGQSWNLINRVILPVVYQPELLAGQGSTFGLGDTSYTAFFSPRKPSKLIWGAGPLISIPTATDIQVGPGEWAAGPSVVLLTMPGSWVVGTLLSNVWSFDSDANINFFFSQIFANYNMKGAGSSRPLRSSPPTGRPRAGSGGPYRSAAAWVGSSRSASRRSTAAPRSSTT